MSGLLCGENSNPLAVFALTAGGTRIHVMSSPNHFAYNEDPMRRVTIISPGVAQMSKAFVISACSKVDERIIQMMEPNPEMERFLRSPVHCGGSIIVAPNSRILAGPRKASSRPTATWRSPSI
jgi:nitrilase